MTKILSIITSISLLTNIVLGIFIIRHNQEMKSGKFEDGLSSQYPYLSKRILMENPNDVIINFIPLRNAMREYIGESQGKIGAYFEFLPSGTSIGVNEQQTFRLASLAKVPLAMSVYREIEKGSFKDDHLLTLTSDQVDKKFGTFWQRGVGTKTTPKDLVYIMLTESDNTAYNMLYDLLSADAVNDVYKALDIPLSGEDLSPTITPKNLSSIFRSLYLSSYLTKEKSNLLLKILTETKFADKIPAGVPPEIKVSHKIGVFEKLDSDSSVFADCGIVFVPNRPYILCVFVNGSDQDAQKEIKIVSKMAYEFVSKVKVQK